MFPLIESFTGKPVDRFGVYPRQAGPHQMTRGALVDQRGNVRGPVAALRYAPGYGLSGLWPEEAMAASRSRLAQDAH